MLVSQILASKPFKGVLTAAPDDPVSDVAAVLSEKRIGALIVSETGSDVAGIISERDIVRQLGKSGDSCLAFKASELMTENVVACRPGETAVSVLERMTEGRFRHMPVMDADRLVGVITIGDVVKARILEVESENSALTDLISGNA